MKTIKKEREKLNGREGRRRDRKWCVCVGEKECVSMIERMRE